MSSQSREQEMVPLTGRGLRFVLLAEIRRRRTMTVAEMVTYLATQGFDVPGRPSKTISDALRWERARGRVVRRCRGVYVYGRTPKATARRVMLFADRCLTWIEAVRRGEEPPPTPPTRPDRVHHFWQPPESPLRPPWKRLGWLWTA